MVCPMLHCGVPKAALGNQARCPPSASDPTTISVPQPDEVTLRWAASYLQEWALGCSSVWCCPCCAVSNALPTAVRSSCRERAGVVLQSGVQCRQQIPPCSTSTADDSKIYWKNDNRCCSVLTRKLVALLYLLLSAWTVVKQSKRS